MIIEYAIKTQLLTNAALIALVGSRIYYIKAPQDTGKPYVVFQKISGVRFNSYAGPSGLVDSRFQFSIFAATYAACKAIAVQIQTTLEGFMGIMGGAGGVNVGAVFYDNEIDMPYDSELQLYGLSMDLKIMYNE